MSLGMITLAVMAHMLGATLLGLLAMIEAYTKLVDQLFRLETWQAFIRYGADALESGDEVRFRRLVKLGVAADMMGALLAGTVAFLAVPLVASWLAWDETTQLMAQVYCIAILFGISSTPIGILRLFDRFAQIAWLSPLLALVRLGGVIALWAWGGSLWSILILEIILQCAERLILSWMAWRELRRQGYRSAMREPLRGSISYFPGITSFVFAANGIVLIRKSTQELDIIVVGGIAGPAGAGIYLFARKFGMAAIKAGSMIQQVAFPDLSRLWVRRDLSNFVATIHRMETMTLLFSAMVVATVLLWGDDLIKAIAGPSFEDALLPLIVQSVASLLFLAGSILRPALAAMHLQMQMLAIVAVSAMAFYLALFIAVPALGVVGASIAHIIFNLVLLPASVVLFVTRLRRERVQVARLR
jgi:O-antigen/teichoic acid export membrane protein